MTFYETTKPTKINDFVADCEKSLKRLEMLINNEMTFPSPAKKAIILHGKYGTGKSELARLLPNLLEHNRAENFHKDGNDPTKVNVMSTFISCQSNNSADSIRLAMPTSFSFNASGLHYVILDEVDNMRSDFQKSMKGFITEYSHVIFIMTTNHLGKVDEGLKSRSHLISFENPDEDLWLKRLISICVEFRVKQDEQFLKNLIVTSQCDARVMMSELEEFIKTQTINTNL